jgi:hypothetical protein
MPNEDDIVPKTTTRKIKRKKGFKKKQQVTSPEIKPPTPT